MEKLTDTCEWCGREYDPDSEGHYHNEDCACEWCVKNGTPLEIGFCGVECEVQWVRENF